MRLARALLYSCVLLSYATRSHAQTPSPLPPPSLFPPPPPPVSASLVQPQPPWDVQLGASFVGTAGNSDATTLGADFAAHWRWPIWRLESSATAVRTTDRGIRTIERYLAAFRADGKLGRSVDLTMGERAERDRFAGIELRSISDVGLRYALVRIPRWTLDGLTSVALNHEQPIVGPDLNHPVGLLQLLSRVSFSNTSDSAMRVTFYPDLNDPNAYRAEGEVTVQAAINNRLALKVGYLWRYSNAPTFGFVRSDSTATASIVIRWKGAMPVTPPPPPP